MNEIRISEEIYKKTLAVVITTNWREHTMYNIDPVDNTLESAGFM